MSETVISWTPANWITIVLMVVLGYAIIGAATRIIQQRKAA
jgi:hypothetical protein